MGLSFLSPLHHIRLDWIHAIWKQGWLTKTKKQITNLPRYWGGWFGLIFEPMTQDLTLKMMITSNRVQLGYNRGAARDSKKFPEGKSRHFYCLQDSHKTFIQYTCHLAWSTPPWPAGTSPGLSPLSLRSSGDIDQLSCPTYALTRVDRLHEWDKPPLPQHNLG